MAYGDRSKHLDAIIGARNLKLFEKNNLLQAIKDHWKADSPTQLASLSGIGLRLVREHAEELLGKSWGFTSDLFKLSDLSGTSLMDLAIVLVESAIARDLSASANTWLSLATILSKQADRDTPRHALERLLDSGAARLADKIGDGPWRSELDPGISTDEIAAGLLWFGLGSPKANARWRAAHAVRAMAKFGRWSIHSFMVAIVDKQLNVTRIEPSALHIEAVSKLDQYSIYDFQKRLSAIKRVLPAS